MVPLVHIRDQKKWTSSDIPTLKKAKTVLSAGKIFRDSQILNYIEYLENKPVAGLFIGPIRHRIAEKAITFAKGKIVKALPSSITIHRHKSNLNLVQLLRIFIEEILFRRRNFVLFLNQLFENVYKSLLLCSVVRF